jgi:peptidoglycan hydrolase-like protein with peptidoglycan-binding domain
MTNIYSETSFVARDLFGVCETDCNAGCSVDSKTGSVSLNAGPSQCKQTRYSHANRSEFARLSSLDGDASSLSGVDVSLLKTRENVLSFLKNHPGLETILRGGTLEYGKSNYLGVNGKSDITPLNYKRLIYYTQLALNLLLPKELKIDRPNGNYDPGTAKCVKYFQEMVGIKDDRNGRVAGKGTFRMLLLHLEFSKKGMVAKLKKAGGNIDSNGFGVLGGCNGGDKQCTANHQAVVDSMRWLGWLPPHRIDWSVAGDVLAKKWCEHTNTTHDGYPIKVGPKVINFLINKVVEAAPHLN